MRASTRMSEKRADLIGRPGRKNMFELARLLFDFGLAVHGQRIGEQAFGKAVPANDIGGTFQSTRR